MAEIRERAISAEMPATTYGAQPSMNSKRHSIGLLLRGLAALALLAPVAVLASSPVAAVHTIAPTVTCQNDYLTDVDGLGVICEVTVVNTITATGGSASVTVHECNGPAGAATTCVTETQLVASPVTNVTQCNGSVNGGGSTFVCSVVVTNNFVGVTPGATSATVDECVGSGGGGGTAMTCTPLSSTTSAVITQCNGSSSGGGGSMICDASGTTASALAVTINQCNGSANGGGDNVVCSATITNNAVPLATPTAAPLATPTAASTVTPPPTSTTGGGSSDNSAPLLPLMILLALSGLVLATVVVQRRHIQN